MKKIILALLVIAALSCKKEKYQCYECMDNVAPFNKRTACNITESEAKRWERNNNWTCTVK
jgi:hypothetical protein